MSQKSIQWLANELPKLVERNIISQEQQHAIVMYYEKEKNESPNIALIAFSIFGAILLAAGIILILAHNWSNLSRSVRTVLSFFPLVTGQVFGFWTILNRRHSIAWCEGISAFTFLTIGSTIALISQTYHIQGELHTFLLTWMILAIPLVYVFASTTASVLYIAGISTWVISASIAGIPAVAYWLLLAAILPMYIIKSVDKGQTKQTTIIGWWISLSLIAGVSVGHTSPSEGFRAISFISLFLSLYIIGNLFNKDRFIWSNPFHRVGILGIAVTYLFLSYRNSWKNLSYHTVKQGLEMTSGDWMVSIGLSLLAVLLLGFALSRRNWISLGMAFGLPLAFIGFGFTDSIPGQSIFTVLFNLYVFAGGIIHMVTGIQSNAGRTVNFGFALVAAIIVLRFFDMNLSFMLRGIIFVILGAGFLLTNIFIAKRRATK